MKYHMTIMVIGLVLLTGGRMVVADEKKYVGSQVCMDCHQEQYDNFIKYSKKANSFKSIKKMEKKLTPEEYQECFECHTTGYRQEGGFVSESLTPGLRNAGCEVCHGPGSVHVESEDPDDIIKQMTMENCVTCHNESRVNAFNFKRLLYGGAH